MKDAQVVMLLLDGKEKKVSKKLQAIGLKDVQLYFPLLPTPGESNRTARWANAAQWFNSLSSASQDRVFYWGPSRFLGSFLSHFRTRPEHQAWVWSHWERKLENRVLRFSGALGVYIPKDVGSITIPTHLGNRFFAQLLKDEMAKSGIPIEHIGQPWPSPAEELSAQKGSAHITLALIAKDEEEFLAGCLEQALPYVDEIVVVDTGSQDRTVQIAEAYGAKVIHHQWQDDFAKARNAYLDQIKDGWVVTLDADEYLTPQAGVWLRRTAETGEHKVYLLRTYNYHHGTFPSFTDQANIRMYWRAKDVRYDGKIHEQLRTSLPRELVGGPVVVHYGYLPSVNQRKKKLGRNENILKDVAPTGTSFDWYNLGLNLMSQNKPREALDALQRYFALAPEKNMKYRPSAYWHAAQAALACNEKELALEYAERACEAPLPDCYYVKGQVLEALGRSLDAVSAYRKAASLPDPPASLYQLFNQSDSSIRLWRAALAAASLLEREKRYEEAEREYLRAVQGDMTNLAALLGVARTKRLQGKEREALKWAQRAVDTYPQEIGAHAEYLEDLLATENVSQAWEHIGESGVPGHGKRDLYLRLGSYALDAGDLELALKASEEATAIDGTSAAGLALKAAALTALGRLQEATDLLASAPAHPEIENQRGCLALAKRSLTEAETHFRTVLSQEPDHEAANINLAKVLILQERIEEALAALSPLLARTENKPAPQAVILVARCFNSLQRYLEALNVLLTINPDSRKPKELFEWNLVKGNSHFGLEQWLEASDCYLAAYRINPNDPELLYRIGLLMLKLQRWEDAKNAFYGVLRFDPQNQNAFLLLEMAQQMEHMVQ